ncbi:MAG TPA: thiamine pyrophosphate-dependent enzyme, partial [Fimbriimonadaceae bacterium]|nr:thiamine pyrophosphate-dependent enzyme [Fimbriimonadaceae bacterium]
QNEQDSRFYAEFAKVPCLEPCSPQEAYDMVRFAFEMSERFALPVMVRLTTRTAHCRSNVQRTRPDEDARTTRPHPNPNDWTLVPSNARRKFARLLKIQDELEAFTAESAWNSLHLAGPRGIVCAGSGYNDLREMVGSQPNDSVLRIGSYPIPKLLVRELVDHCSEILVLEDGYPFLESRIVGLLGIAGKAIRGRLDGSVPEQGELDSAIVGAALSGSPGPSPALDPIVSPRPPQLCKGCPHADSFGALLDAVAEYSEAILFSDIGCYTLGVMEPFRAVHSCVDMGASIGMAHGASRAGAHPVLCTIGDSTFAHSGMTPLLGAVRSDADITVVLLDNATTAMTGAQDSMTTGEDLTELLRGLGVRDLHVFEPHRKNHAANVEILKAAIAHRGLSVIVARRACIHYKKSAVELPICQVA